MPRSMESQQIPRTVDRWRSLERRLDLGWRAGRRAGGRVFGVVFRYAVLCGLAFTMLYPVLFVISASIKDANSLADASVQWIPRHISLFNFKVAWALLQYASNLRVTLLYALISACFQVVACAFVGYGFSRSNIPGMNVLTALLLVALIVPAQAVIVPLYRQYGAYHWLGTYLPFWVPAALGHGIRGALFVLMYRQYFKGIPWEMEESARIDGAGAFRLFWQVLFPLAKPIILVVFLFSLVWHWNDTFSTGMFFNASGTGGLAVALKSVPFLVTQGQNIQGIPRGMGGNLGTMTLPFVTAGAVLVLVPLLLLYVYAQRYFVESLERTGLTGE